MRNASYLVIVGIILLLVQDLARSTIKCFASSAFFEMVKGIKEAGNKDKLLVFAEAFCVDYSATIGMPQGSEVMSSCPWWRLWTGYINLLKAFWLCLDHGQEHVEAILPTPRNCSTTEQTRGDALEGYVAVIPHLEGPFERVGQQRHRLCGCGG